MSTKEEYSASSPRDERERKKERSRRSKRSASASSSGSDDGPRRRHKGGSPRRGRSTSRSRGRSRRHSRSSSRSSSGSRSSSQSSWYQRMKRRRRAGRKSNFDVKPAGWAEGLAGPKGALAAMPNQQTRHARRLYIGNISNVDEERVKNFFTYVVKTFVKIDLPEGTPPVISVYVNHERKFAFVEFATIELANTCLKLDGLDYEGLPLRIRRPNDYNPAVIPEDIRDRTEPVDYNGLKFTGQDGDDAAALSKVFVGGMPSGMTEQQLREVFSAFGPLKEVNLVRDAGGQSRGYAFLEYEDERVVPSVVETMNGFRIGERSLTVSISKNTMGGGVGADGATSANLAHMAHMPVIPAQISGPARPSNMRISRIVCIKNMLEPSDVQNPDDYRELVQYIAEECAKYGVLTGVFIPRPSTAGVGRCFLEYADPASSSIALAHLQGRTFGDVPMEASFFSEMAFRAGRYDA